MLHTKPGAARSGSQDAQGVYASKFRRIRRADTTSEGHQSHFVRMIVQQRSILMFCGLERLLEWALCADVTSGRGIGASRSLIFGQVCFKKARIRASLFAILLHPTLTVTFAGLFPDQRVEGRGGESEAGAARSREQVQRSGGAKDTSRLICRGYFSCIRRFG